MSREEKEEGREKFDAAGDAIQSARQFVRLRYTSRSFDGN